jgi:hypothetical protein
MPLTKTALIAAAEADVATTVVVDLPAAEAGNAARDPTVVATALAATVTKATVAAAEIVPEGAAIAEAAAATGTIAPARNNLPRACSLRWNLPDLPSRG